MLLAPRFNQIDLPVYGPDTPVAYPDDLPTIHETCEDDSFVRFAKIDASRGFTSLADALRTTERELAELARLCGAKVVGHTWGLHQFRAERAAHEAQVFGRSNLPDFPPGHFLVAEVDMLEPAISDLELQRLIAGIGPDIDRYAARTAGKQTRLYDVGQTRDFVVGNKRRDLRQRRPTAAPSLWYTDIEPYLKPVE